MSDPMMPMPTRQGLVARIQGILLKPSETWDLIAAEPSSIQSIFMGYVVPLSLIGPICGLLAASVVGAMMMAVGAHMGLMWLVIMAVINYALGLASVYIMSFVVDALAPSFGGQKNMLNAFKLVAYSGTAGYLSGIFALLPVFGLLLVFLALLYSIYIFYLGLPKLMKNPEDKSVVYMIVIAICGLVMGAIMWTIIGIFTAIGVGAAALTAGHLAMTTPGGSFTVHGKDGSATVNIGQMAAAASSYAAQALAVQNGTAAPVKVADAASLLGLTPPIFNGAVRADTSTSSGGAGGVNVSTAEATYSVGGGSIHLKVSDSGGLAGLGGMLNAMNVNASSSSAGSYEVTKTDGNRMTQESYNSAEKSGHYTVVLDGRISVEAEGNNVDMDTMKALVSQIDVNKAEALTH